MKTLAKSTALTGSYAVMRCGGKQYTVSGGQRLAIEKIPGRVGDEVSVEDILLISHQKEENQGDPASPRTVLIGNPRVEGASVKLKILRQLKSKKVRVFKKKRRTGYTKRQGHRQQLTEVLVQGIITP